MKPESIKKSVRNAAICSAVLALYSFFYGGIYTEIIVKGMGFSLKNLIFAFIGAVYVGFIIAFVPVFGFSLIYYYIKESKEEKPKKKNKKSKTKN